MALPQDLLPANVGNCGLGQAGEVMATGCEIRMGKRELQDMPSRKTGLDTKTCHIGRVVDAPVGAAVHPVPQSRQRFFTLVRSCDPSSHPPFRANRSR